MLIWDNWDEPGQALHWRVERGRGLCVCTYVTVCSRVVPWVHLCWLDGEGRAVEGLKNLCMCTSRRALLAVHVLSVILRGG